MSVENTREAVLAYLQEHDMARVADDAVFTMMGTGQEFRGREAIDQMLGWFYHGAFSARAETRTIVISDEHAVLEADVVGKHTGEFAGVPASGKDVRIPLCVVYDVQLGQIVRARIYLETDVFRQQTSA